MSFFGKPRLRDKNSRVTSQNEILTGLTVIPASPTGQEPRTIHLMYLSAKICTS